jgi:hypothetical protein
VKGTVKTEVAIDVELIDLRSGDSLTVASAKGSGLWIGFDTKPSEGGWSSGGRVGEASEAAPQERHSGQG